MKTAIMLIGVVASILVLGFLSVLLIGSRLPQEHVASRSIKLSRSPKEVYALVRDFSGYPRWRSDVQSVDLLGSPGGHIQFRENGSSGGVTYEVVEEVPDQRLVTRIVDRDLGYSGSWTYLLTPSESGTLLTITERGEVSNLVFRFMSRYFFGHTQTIDSYLIALARHFADSSQPQGAPDSR